MEEEPKKSFVKICEGIFVPKVYSEEKFRSAINYKPKKDDLFIVSYPKCGTTWMQHIVLLILRHGKPIEDPSELFLGSPFLEIKGAEVVECMPRPCAIKTHLPYDKVPLSKDAKYIYVCRNPKDCVVSFYYHMKDKRPKGFETQTFDEFFEYFLRGEVPFGDYFDHIVPWYEHRDDVNVYIVTYENLKKDIRGEILKLARFIGEEYEMLLLNESKILDDIIHYSSFEYMKKDANETAKRLMKAEAVSLLEEKNLPPCVTKTFKDMDAMNKKKPGREPALRKGIVGDWINHLNPDQVQRLEERVADKTAKSDVMNLWK